MSFPAVGGVAASTGNRRTSLGRELAAAIDGEVRFDSGGRALYATDLSIYRQVPIGVVLPRTVDDIVRTVEICGAHDAPILGRGGGTSLVGQCTNEAVVIDCSKYLNRILEIDPEKKLARVEPGVVCDDLKFAAEEHGLTWGPDPATHQYATVCGMLGNNSCGVHSVLTEFYGGGSRPATATPISSASGTRKSRVVCPATTSTSCSTRAASTSPARLSARSRP